MSIITLTTDFGIKDHFLGSVKGALHQNIPDVKIVDISNNISPFNIIEAAYIIENSYKNFPKNSIHIIGVDSELTPEKKHLAVYLDEHYFICSDNGILSLLFNKIKPEKIIEISIYNNSVTSFPVLDVFIKVAAHIYRGGNIDLVGNKTEKVIDVHEINPILNQKKNEITGHVIYIDNYENVVINISKDVFKKFGKSRPYIINARNYQFKKIYKNYSDAIKFDIKKEFRKEEGKKIALFNKSDYLELSIYKSNPELSGGASSLFGLKYRDVVTISFQ
ncbi:MAG: hypothetical protein CMC84_05695 [Flavobacteriaceae bacterium]|nr:hypothetical protein [Flavobacteriaceae bacterium]|tara:strand:- start:1857 stop:2687 length:831 start_codon:yes stop_codon:yes gene_type:complete